MGQHRGYVAQSACAEQRDVLALSLGTRFTHRLDQTFHAPSSSTCWSGGSRLYNPALLNVLIVRSLHPDS